MSRSRIVSVVAGPVLLHPVTQRKAEQMISDGKAERRSRFLIELVDRGCNGPTPVAIEGSALMKAFQLTHETAAETASLIRSRSPYTYALNNRPRTGRKR